VPAFVEEGHIVRFHNTLIMTSIGAPGASAQFNLPGKPAAVIVLPEEWRARSPRRARRPVACQRVTWDTIWLYRGLHAAVRLVDTLGSSRTTC
jgi:hypothetical protein